LFSLLKNYTFLFLADFLTPQKFSEAMMTITTWVINMAPVGVFFLIGGQVKDKPQQFLNIFWS
jgi:Na+/H+-dicarboxylate symporter